MNKFIQYGQNLFIGNKRKIDNKRIAKHGADICIRGGGLCEGCDFCIEVFEQEMWEKEVACY